MLTGKWLKKLMFCINLPTYGNVHTSRVLTLIPDTCCYTFELLHAPLRVVAFCLQHCKGAKYSLHYFHLSQNFVVWKRGASCAQLTQEPHSSVTVRCFRKLKSCCYVIAIPSCWHRCPNPNCNARF